MRPLFLMCLLSLPAWAYSIGTAFSEPCHEKLTSRAFEVVRSELQLTVLPTGKGPRLEETFFATPQTEAERFALMSLLVGVHAPDTEGHSLLEVENTRLIHVPPLDQYGHALRNADDDGAEGELHALDGIEARLTELLGDVREELARPPEQQREYVDYYFDGYGLQRIEVWSPAYRLGRAIHLVQDSFSHALRSEDFHRIRHLLNYADAITPHYEEERDGLRHAGSLDACGSETEPLTSAAVEASAELLRVMLIERASSEPFLARWLGHEDGCAFNNSYCDSPWVEVAREDPTRPLLGCSSANALPLLWLALWFSLPRRRYRLMENVRLGGS